MKTIAVFVSDYAVLVMIRCTSERREHVVVVLKSLVDAVGLVLGVGLESVYVCVARSVVRCTLNVTTFMPFVDVDNDVETSMLCVESPWTM